jgi:hypothetical protein
MSDVTVTIGSKNSALDTGLAKAKSAVDGFATSTSNSFKQVGGNMLAAFGVTAILAGVKSLFDEFGKVQDLSDRLGETAESLQRIGNVSELSGAGLETVAKAAQKVNGNALAAVKGNGELAEAFTTLGVNAADFVNLPLEEKLIALAGAYESAGSDAEKMDAVIKVLGKSGAELIPVLKMGSDALREEFAGAAVASDEAVSALDNAGDSIGKVFQQIKVWGAEGINFVIKRIEALGVALAVAVAYVSNLGKGFDAAKQAAADAMQAAADLQVEKDKEAQEKKESKKKNQVNTDRLAGIEEAKKAESEIAKLKEENAKKEHDAYLRSLSLLEKKAEIEREITKATLERDNAKNSPLEREQAKGKILDLTKDRETINKELAREDEKAMSENSKKLAKLAKERIKEQLNAKKDELKGAEKDLGGLEKAKSFSVDSLRAIGGGIAGAHYNPSASKDDMQRQQVDLAKQTVTQLTAVVAALEAADKSVTTYDGGFTD